MTIIDLPSSNTFAIFVIGVLASIVLWDAFWLHLVSLFALFGLILAPFWGLGGSLGPCRDVVGKLSGSWVVFGSLEVHFSLHFGIIFCYFFALIKNT